MLFLLGKYGDALLRMKLNSYSLNK
uniref:Uncharacterized protein n=1 Tax=Anguilla anguilla TaxID=7936 RepID=A0A0E9TTA3_ANGAN